MPKTTEHPPLITENAFIDYCFLYCRRQWASFSDLLIPFTVLGLCQCQVLTHWGRNPHICVSSSYKERGVQTWQGYAAQWGDLLPSWEPRYSWALAVTQPCSPKKTGTESTRKEMSYVLQLLLFHSISAYIKLFCCYDKLLNCFWKMLACLVKTVVWGLFCSVYLKVYRPTEFGKMP